MHRYEQVDLPSNKAVTLTLGTNGGRDRGDVTGPAKLTFGPTDGRMHPSTGIAYTDKSLRNG
jgi:hypothetical protein